MNFTNRPASSLEGAAGWINTNSFTNGIVLAGSSYVPPLVNNRALDVTNATVTFGLSTSITNTILWRTNNTITISGGTNHLALTVTTTSGFISGSFLHPTTHQSTALKGVILQQTRDAAGFSQGAGQTGGFKLEPQ